MRSPSWPLVLAFLSLPLPLWAQEPEGLPPMTEPGAEGPAAAAKPAASTTAGGGDSVADGDAAAVARNYDAALQAYRTVLKKSPQDAMLHYRMGQVLTMKGDFEEADREYSRALELASKAPGLAAKILFCLADLRERQQAMDEATEAWNSYESYAKSQTGVSTYPATAVERKSRIQAWKKISAEAAEVKARIKQREEESDRELRRNSK